MLYAQLVRHDRRAAGISCCKAITCVCRV
jgi:hypothetical protein